MAPIYIGLVMFNNYEEIEKWLNDYCVNHYVIDKTTLMVNVKGCVDLENCQIKMLPFQFGSVEGEFNISKNELFSLKGSPHYVSKNFNSSYNQLTTLDFLPTSPQIHLMGNLFNDLNFLFQENNQFHKLTLSISSSFKLEHLSILKQISFEEVYLYFQGMKPEDSKNVIHEHHHGYYYVIHPNNKSWLIDYIISQEKIKQIHLLPKTSQRKTQF